MIDHNILNIESDGRIMTQTLLNADNNLDGKHNIDELPELPSRYAICGRVNGKPANARYVGVTDNLRTAVEKHFSEESDQSLKTFMTSIKIKELVYELLEDVDMTASKDEWVSLFKPECNEELNKTY